MLKTKATKQQTNQERYRGLLEQAGISQVRSAELLVEQTGRPCTSRAVRTWLCDSGKSSARPCPDWAVSNLEIALKKEGLIA